MMSTLPRRLMLFAALLSLVSTGCHRSSSSGANEPAGGKRIRLGVEVLLEDRLELVRGKRLALVAHPASVAYDSIPTLDTLLGAGLKVVKMFAPEHGFRGGHEAGASVQDGRDPATGLPIRSLHGGDGFRPDSAELAGLDAVLFDLQDAGARFYTYLSTLSYLMEACAETGTQLIVLDRPNPNGWYCDGPLMDAGHTSFLGVHKGVPIAHGLTLGEYAAMANTLGWLAEDEDLACPLTVVWMEGYRHAMRWEDTGLAWHAPSPNLRSIRAAELYPGFAWLEQTLVSVGRGTDAPFERYGFPYHTALHSRWLKDSVRGTPNPLQIKGLRAVAERFIPRSQPGKAARPKYEADTCWGFHIQTRPDSGAQVFLAGLDALRNFHTEYHEHHKLRDKPIPRPFFKPHFERLSGTRHVREAIQAGTPPEAIYARWQQELRGFRRLRQQFLHYPQ